MRALFPGEFDLGAKLAGHYRAFEWALAVMNAMRDHDIVFHFAANADVRFGTNHPRRDLEQNTIGTHNVLEAMRSAGVNQIAFSSTGSVYGEPAVFPTPEDAPYDQDHDEWILLLRGAAGLWIDGEKEYNLRPGDHLLIPARHLHRVTWTAPGEATVWLAVHFPT